MGHRLLLLVSPSMRSSGWGGGKRGNGDRGGPCSALPWIARSRGFMKKGAFSGIFEKIRARTFNITIFDSL